MDPSIVQSLITALIAFLASGAGFWAYLRTRHEAKSATTRMLMGLARDKLISLGMSYIDRGWITRDEYEDYMEFFYNPYIALGGDGTAERVMHGVERLPLRSGHIIDIPVRADDDAATEEDIRRGNRYYAGEERRSGSSS